jgi:tRNA threonylcarbamoyladenosine biosynthesis protein TsaB
LALGAPCVGVGTLQALAASVTESGVVAAAIDARRGQLYLQLFRDGAPLAPPQALTLVEAQTKLNELGEEPVTLIGSGAALLTHGLNMPVSERVFPDPVALARLTMRATEPIATPAPLYLRPPDAKTIAERAAP